MEKGKQVVIEDEERKQLRVCYDRSIPKDVFDALIGPLEDQEFEIDSERREKYATTLGRFLQHFEESPACRSVPGMKQVYHDLARLHAFLIHRPQRFFGDDIVIREIDYLAERVAMIIWRYNLEKMNQDKASEMVERFNYILKIMPHRMELVRVIFGKTPKESPLILNLIVNAVLNFDIPRSPFMDPPKESIQDDDDDSCLKELEFTDFSNLNGRYMAHLLLYRIHNVLRRPAGHLRDEVEQIFEKRPKPSRSYYPRTGQLDFLDHLAGNLKELLLNAKANASLSLAKSDIFLLQLELQDVSCRLIEIPETRKEAAHVRDVITSIANLAYEAEYVVDSFLVGDMIPNCYSVMWLRDIKKELEHQLRIINMEFADAESIFTSILYTKYSKGLRTIPIFHDNTEIGDTLKEVFNRMHDKVSLRTRSLVTSYKERKKEVFLDLLRNASFSRPYYKPGDKIAYSSDMSEAELEKSIYNLLQYKSYFVILEDVQDIHVLNDIKRVLPDHLYSSWLLFTTPSSELILQSRGGFIPKFEHYSSTSQTDKPKTENDVVGFIEETKEVLEWLTGGPKKLLIISIIGMAGQGKTTLAKKLFNDPLVDEYFDTRAWCYVSQTYEKRQLLLELLGQLIQLSSVDHDDITLAHMLYKELKGRRFLIFLDDMWKIDAWNDLTRCFPNDNNGSRIIFTTRILDLASQAKFESILQPIGLLSDDESWELLQNKLFLKEGFPTKLSEVGRQIAKNCKGLPLSVVLVAGLLTKMEKSVNHWEQIAENLSSIILNDAEAQASSIIELSYKHLPDHLKSCFLYFGAFLEEKEVLVSKLIRLWNAEGFVKYIDLEEGENKGKEEREEERGGEEEDTNGGFVYFEKEEEIRRRKGKKEYTNLKSLEDVAENYLMNLIGRSLVTISQEKSNGKVKSCHVHDLLREFCLNKAKEENFLQKINGYHDNLDHDMDPSDTSSSTTIKYHLRRLCIYAKRNQFTMLKSSGPLVRSLLFFVASDVCPSYSYDISSIFHNFKFLKILNLEGINIGDSFKGIGALILLKYLACQSNIDVIPSSIANLCNLQTFLFKGVGVEVVKVLDSIWDMTKLRHMHINNSASFDLGPDGLENSSILDNLRTFSTPNIAYGDATEKMLRKVRGIQKLKCIFLDSWNDATNCNQFPDLGFLSQLVALNVFYSGMGNYPCKFNLPSNLKKLTLSNFQMPWNEISQLAKALCNLEVLKLLHNAFMGERWEMEDEVFPKLKFLKLDTLNIKEWTVIDDNFLNLNCLILHNCEQLVEIPRDMGEIPTLRMIEVKWCSRSVVISAIKIQEEQQEYGEGLKIHVHPKI